MGLSCEHVSYLSSNANIFFDGALASEITLSNRPFIPFVRQLERLLLLDMGKGNITASSWLD